MTMTELAEHVEKSFNPRRTTHVSVERSSYADRHGRLRTSINWTIYIEGEDQIEGESLEAVRAQFDASYAGLADVDSEAALVDVE